MSHSLTITRTTVATSGTPVYINSGYMSSTPGLLKLAELEVIYHGVAFVLYLSAGITLMVEVNHYKDYYRRDYEPYLAAAIMGLIMAALYLLSTFLANRQYRGI
ncbi:hypothetical protein HF086_004001 [Spodoptera exigua]|uniref:Uncharacterized protein n=1 Tax=Spodoptera exigua TaxID=7107 RepID=A0A922SAU0_SPOEX|nr:hypothetical protein HF086_004001 [Spodoptera exigua]